MENIISLKNVKFTYAQNENVLNDISFDGFSGEIIGYIGQNGSGKTTTIKLLLNILSGYLGEIEIFGKNIKNQFEYKFNIGYVPENAYIYENLRGYELLDFIGRIYKIDRKKLRDKIFTLSKLFDIQDVINSKISTYSKGMKQKIMILSAFIHNPDLIILDEPLNGLDMNSIEVFNEIMLKQKAKGKTFFYSTHFIDIIEKISDRIILINNGKIIFNDKTEKLKTDNKQIKDSINKLTGYNKYKEIAGEFIKTIED